jgi:hypothetical protein
VVRGLAESLACGLLGDAENCCDLGPGPSVLASPANLVGQGEVKGCHRMQGLGDLAQVPPSESGEASASGSSVSSQASVSATACTSWARVRGIEVHLR